MNINTKPTEPRSFDAVMSLVSDAKFAIQGTDILKWDGPDGKQPTKSEIETELNRLKTEYTNAKYQRDRKPEYPDIGDQLDKIYHSGIDAWKADIKKVKDDNPKP